MVSSPSLGSASVQCWLHWAQHAGTHILISGLACLLWYSSSFHSHQHKSENSTKDFRAELLCQLSLKQIERKPGHNTQLWKVVGKKTSSSLFLPSPHLNSAAFFTLAHYILFANSPRCCLFPRIIGLSLKGETVLRPFGEHCGIFAVT